MNKLVKVSIDDNVLRELIRTKTSIRKLGPMIGHNEKTIRRGLKEKEMSLELVALLAAVLEVDARTFADLKSYWEVIKSRLVNGAD